jgi:hypothetical protein
MSDEHVDTTEIPAHDDGETSDLSAIDRDTSAHFPRMGAALSVLWWVEGEPIPSR